MIEFREAGFKYGDRTILRDVNLRLDPGSMHFLTGRSGAGKTTLLKLMHFGLIPTTGQVRVFGRDSKGVIRREQAEMRRRMGVVLQDCDLLDHMTVLENIALPMRIGGAKVAEFGRDLRELGVWVGLGRRLNARAAA